MEREAAAKPPVIILPMGAADVADIGRLVHELELIEEALLQSGIRTAGKEVKMPKTSRLMDQLIETNRLNLLRPADSLALKRFLETVKKQSPVLHISFAADPSPHFIERLMVWLRREIHPTLLLTIGLQPTIGAGCIVRTTSKQFDFSLGQDLFKKKELLLAQLKAPPAASAKEPA